MGSRVRARFRSLPVSIIERGHDPIQARVAEFAVLNTAEVAEGPDGEDLRLGVAQFMVDARKASSNIDRCGSTQSRAGSAWQMPQVGWSGQDSVTIVSLHVRAAARQRIGLSKVRRFDPLAADYGLWRIDDPHRGRHLTDLTLDQVEHYLQTGEGPTSSGE